jgi:hypothetical protein
LKEIWDEIKTTQKNKNLYENDDDDYDVSDGETFGIEGSESGSKYISTSLLPSDDNTNLLHPPLSSKFIYGEPSVDIVSDDGLKNVVLSFFAPYNITNHEFNRKKNMVFIQLATKEVLLVYLFLFFFFFCNPYLFILIFLVNNIGCSKSFGRDGKHAFQSSHIEITSIFKTTTNFRTTKHCNTTYFKTAYFSTTTHFETTYSVTVHFQTTIPPFAI